MVRHWQEHRLLEDEFLAQLTAALQTDGATTTTSAPKVDSSPSAGSATARSVQTPASTEMASTTARGAGDSKNAQRHCEVAHYNTLLAGNTCQARRATMQAEAQ
jgi:hypothetical protein